MNGETRKKLVSPVDQVQCFQPSVDSVPGDIWTFETASHCL